MKKEFEKEPLYDKNVLRTKSYANETTDFHDEKMPKIGSNYICLAAILIDFVLKKDKNYYAQVFLNPCKYIRYITDDLSISSDVFDKE